MPNRKIAIFTSDVVAEDQRRDRIVLEVQHVEDSSFNERLVLYTAKHTVASRIKGEDYKLRNLNLVSLQMFDSFPESPNYRYSIRLKNQENEVFYKIVCPIAGKGKIECFYRGLSCK